METKCTAWRVTVWHWNMIHLARSADAAMADAAAVMFRHGVLASPTVPPGMTAEACPEFDRLGFLSWLGRSRMSEAQAARALEAERRAAAAVSDILRAQVREPSFTRLLMQRTDL